MNQIVSNMNLPGARSALNADNLFDTPRIEPFVTAPFATRARAIGSSIFFGLINDIGQFEVPTDAYIRWDQQDAPGVIDSVFSWEMPLDKLVVGPSSTSSFSGADFDRPVTALRIESHRHRTIATFGNLTVTEGGLEVVPVELDWKGTTDLERHYTESQLVEQHFDKILEGKITKILKGFVPLARQKAS